MAGAHRGKEAEGGPFFCENTFLVLDPVLSNLALFHVVLIMHMQGRFYYLCQMVKFREVQHLTRGYPACEPEFMLGFPDAGAPALPTAQCNPREARNHLGDCQALAWPTWRDTFPLLTWQGACIFRKPHLGLSTLGRSRSALAPASCLREMAMWDCHLSPACTPSCSKTKGTKIGAVLSGRASRNSSHHSGLAVCWLKMGHAELHAALGGLCVPF